jgi:hypothetical protein
MYLLKIINYLNFTWNRFINFFHYALYEIGLNRLSVLFYDTLIWRLSDKHRVIDGKTYNEYLLEHELNVQTHQTHYFANLASDLMWEKINLLIDESEDLDIDELDKSKSNILNHKESSEEKINNNT